MSTCNQLELQTLGSQPGMPKTLPDHWLLLFSLNSNHDLLSSHQTLCYFFLDRKLCFEDAYQGECESL